MKCYNCESTTELKEWKFPGSKKMSCKVCSEYFRKCMIGCDYDVDLNDYDTRYEILSEDKILCDKVVCYHCVRDGNLPKEYGNEQLETKTVRKNKITKKK